MRVVPTLSVCLSSILSWRCQILCDLLFCKYIVKSEKFNVPSASSSILNGILLSILLASSRSVLASCLLLTVNYTYLTHSTMLFLMVEFFSNFSSIKFRYMSANIGDRLFPMLKPSGCPYIVLMNWTKFWFSVASIRLVMLSMSVSSNLVSSSSSLLLDFGTGRSGFWLFLF